MPEKTAVDGSPLAPESLQMMAYLAKRSAELSATAIRERIRAAARELEETVASIPAADARIRPISGKWNIAEVVDHISQTQVRAAEELRHLFAGRRPPLPPVYEALRSGAGEWAPWQLLVDELHQANRALLEVLEGATDSPPPDAVTVRTVMVALCKQPDGTSKPQIWFEDLGWKEYALCQRLHLLDHRTQVKKLREALPSGHSAQSRGA